MWFRSLGWEGLLEKEMATCSSVLAWKIPWTEEPGRLPSMGHKESDTTEHACTQSKNVFIPLMSLPLAKIARESEVLDLNIGSYLLAA